MAAMREALTKVSEWMAHRIATGGFEASPTIPTVLEDVVLPALSAPPRNCDVGTAKEQDERFRDFCPMFVGGGTCTGCELRDCGCAECGFAWAQMPYTEGGNIAD